MTDTTDLIQRLSDEADLCRNDGATDIAGLLDDTIAALEQQAAPSVAPEPVAWMSVDCIGERYLCFSKPMDNDTVTPLFAHPPRAPLTDAEIVSIMESCLNDWDWKEFARAVESAHGISAEGEKP